MCVKTAYSFIQTASVTSGVPEGFFMETLLFLVYINYVSSFFLGSDFLPTLKRYPCRTMHQIIRLDSLCSVVLTYSLTLAHHGGLLAMMSNVL